MPGDFSRLGRVLASVAASLWAGPASAATLITRITTDQACYRPGRSVTISIDLTNAAGRAAAGGTVSLSCSHLDTPLPAPHSQAFHLGPGASQTLVFRWSPPTKDFQGYTVEAEARDASGRVLDREGTAVDVSSTWTRFPRYGFLSRFPSQPSRVSEDEIRQLKDFHINSVQFQDWQYKHHLPLAGTVAHPAPFWKDIANRPTSRQTILDLIRAAHRAGMAAMNYNLLYGAWSGYGNEGVDYRWGLWKNRDGTDQDSFPLPGGWATPTVYLFNPADPGWQDFLIAREADVFATYPFDGWQVDQLGDRGAEFDVSGHPVTLWQTFRPFLNAAKARLHKTILFNNVGAYGLYDTAANSTEDAVYVECWEWAGQATYGDLATLIGQASDWSRGKGVVLAAYLDRSYGNKFSAGHPGVFNPPGVLLADAAIFANGGSHIEMGDDTHLLDTEYFPNRNLAVSDTLRRGLRRYYDFLVAYENLLGGDLTPTKQAIALSSPSGGEAAADTVWAFAKAGHGRQVLHLINLRGEKSIAWRDDQADEPPPTPQANVAVTYHTGSRTITHVGWASPDEPTAGFRPLPFTTGTDAQGHYVQFHVPRLAYWDMILMK